MSAKHHVAFLTNLASMALPVALAGFFYFVATAYPRRIWESRTCFPDDAGVCQREPMMQLLGALLVMLWHAACVAIFFWTPLSSPLRRVDSDKEPRRAPMLNAFLYGSVLVDMIAYSIAFASTIAHIDDYLGMFQACFVTFNAPFSVIFPYLVAAYRDETTDLGALLHKVKARIADPKWDPFADSEHFPLTFEEPEIESESAPLVARSGVEDLERDASTPTPVFSLFVTAPDANYNSADSQRLPMPITQRA